MPDAHEAVQHMHILQFHHYTLLQDMGTAPMYARSELQILLLSVPHIQM